LISKVDVGSGERGDCVAEVSRKLPRGSVASKNTSLALLLLLLLL
jgi:hypothetical protein